MCSQGQGSGAGPNPGADDKQDHHTQIIFLGGGHHAVCGILVPGPKTETRPSIVRVQTPNLWIAGNSLAWQLK